MSAETAKYMAERGIFYTPTLATSHVWNRHPYNKMLPPANLEKNNSVMHAGLRAAKVTSPYYRRSICAETTAVRL